MSLEINRYGGKRLHKTHKHKTHKRKTHKHKMRNTVRKFYKKNRKHKYKGGFIGKEWNGEDIGKWPGVSGPHDGTYLPYKGIPSGHYDPPMPSNSQFQNGGGIIPQELVNFGRSLTGSLQGAYSSYKGEPRFDSSYPLPTTQPSMDREIQTQSKYNPINLDKIHNSSGNSVSNI